ncbi:MAG: hypothetical protein ACK4UN_09640 [Limisphaerales bacterium]
MATKTTPKKKTAAKKNTVSALPIEIQNYIETRLNGAVDTLRHEAANNKETLAAANISQLDNIAKNKWKPLTYIGWILFFLAFVGNIIAFFKGREFIEDHTTKYVNAKLIEPSISNSVSTVIQRQAGEFVTNQIAPLQSRLGTFDVNISELQARIDQAQGSIREHAKIRELALASMSGSNAAFLELKALSARDDEIKSAAATALVEVEMFFEAESKSLSYSTISDNSASPEEILRFLSDPNPKLREAVLNTLANRKRKSTVAPICDAIIKDDNLKVIARGTRALEQITGHKFNNLDLEEVKTWWANNRESYPSDYESYERAAELISAPIVTIDDLTLALSLLDRTISIDPDALHARCLKGLAFIMADQLHFAEAELTEVEKRKRTYPWLLLCRAALHLKNAQTDAAVDSMNKSLRSSPRLETAARHLGVFEPLWQNPLVDWPSQPKGAPSKN